MIGLVKIKEVFNLVDNWKTWLLRVPDCFGTRQSFVWPPIEARIAPLADKDCSLDFELIGQNQQGFWMQLKVVCKYEPTQKEGNLQGQVTFRGYASAGNTYDKRSRFCVWFAQLLDPRKIGSSNQ